MRYLFLCLLALVISQNASAQMKTRVVKDSLFIPWEIVYGPDDHIWFTQKNGYICRLDPVSGATDTLYRETNTVVNNEGGMLGMALHPSFATQPYVYVAYEYTAGSYRERIVRYTYASNALSSPVVLMDSITGNSIHNGCRLLIVGDKLFITTGDANTTANSQNLASKNGKTLRINLDGSIPSDNPIPGSPVWSWGHRNAQGMVYANGRLYQSEHGPNTDDEINIIQQGRNYGWPTVRGYCDQPAEMTFCNDSNVVEPIRAWTPTIAVCGLDYYDHPMFPGLQKSLLLTTLVGQALYQLKLNSSLDSVVSTTSLYNNFGRLRDVCVAPSGKIYISTSNSSASGSGAKVDKIIEIYDSTVAPNSISKTQHGSLNIYPNPGAKYVIVELPAGLSTATMEYSVLDASGRLVLKGKVYTPELRISTRELAAGAYLLRLSTADGKVLSGKLEKQ